METDSLVYLASKDQEISQREAVCSQDVWWGTEEWTLLLAGCTYLCVSELSVRHPRKLWRLLLRSYHVWRLFSSWEKWSHPPDALANCQSQSKPCYNSELTPRCSMVGIAEISSSTVLWYQQSWRRDSSPESKKRSFSLECCWMWPNHRESRWMPRLPGAVLLLWLWQDDWCCALQ